VTVIGNKILVVREVFIGRDRCRAMNLPPRDRLGVCSDDSRHTRGRTVALPSVLKYFVSLCRFIGTVAGATSLHALILVVVGGLKNPAVRTMNRLFVKGKNVIIIIIIAPEYIHGASV